LIVLAWAACDFRQITEDRPVKLPAESTEPKELHPAETSQGCDRTTRPGHNRTSTNHSLWILKTGLLDDEPVRHS
jgi:hypothetical protein